MKCPKCGYLGFERVDRCRNCGYEFLLADSVDPLELPLRTEPREPTPLDDLSLVDAAAAPPTPRLTDIGADPRRDVLHRASSRRSAAATEELPLFGARLPDDAPLITRPSPPRAPLSVRRATPEIPRVRSAATALNEQPRIPLDLALDEFPSEAQSEQERTQRRERAHREVDVETAAVAARGFAVVVDLLILAAIDAAVVYFTMQICGITAEELGILPKGPLLAFLLVQNGGYLIAFTAGGQTLGKMTAGIRVVTTEPGGTLDLGRACVRTVVWVLLAVPAGLGFLTALFNTERRGLHDRFAGTRVIRASV